MTPIQITYNDVVVTYNENDNDWNFELRGRHRTTKSLTSAKEAIDRAPETSRDKVTPKRMDPIPVFTLGYNGLKRGKLTSFDEKYGGAAGWVVIEGVRAKKCLTGVYLDNPVNASLLGTYTQAEAKREEYSQIKALIMQKMEHPKDVQ